MDVVALLYDRLSADLPLAALLSDYRGQPAVFSEAVPPDAEPPWILIEGVAADVPQDARGLRLRELRLALRCFDATGAGSGRLEAVAARARTLLHDGELMAPAAALLAQTCHGPTRVRSERGFLERRLELRLLLNETEEA